MVNKPMHKIVKPRKLALDADGDPVVRPLDTSGRQRPRGWTAPPELPSLAQRDDEYCAYWDRLRSLVYRARMIGAHHPADCKRACARLEKIFPKHDPESGRSFSLLDRITLAAWSAASLGGTDEQRRKFDFEGRVGRGASESAFLVIMALRLALDVDEANELPLFGSLGILPWDSGEIHDVCGRSWVSWCEGRDWMHGNRPHPRILDRFERALQVVERSRRA